MPRHLLTLLVGKMIVDQHGNTLPIRHGYRDGLTPAEVFACVPGAREGLQRAFRETEQNYAINYGLRGSARTGAFTVLARAMRAAHPGIVFASAAAGGEIDPLTIWTAGCSWERERDDVIGVFKNRRLEI